MQRLAPGVSAHLRVLAALAALASMVTEATTESVAFDIPAGGAGESLYSLTLQSGLQVLFDSYSIKGVTPGVVRGDLQATEALSTILSGTPLVYAFINERTVTIDTRAKSIHGQSIRFPTKRAKYPREAAHAGVQAERLRLRHRNNPGLIPEIVVRGAGSVNVDIVRIVNDDRPCVILNQGALSRSEAPDIEDFLRAHLTMNWMA